MEEPRRQLALGGSWLTCHICIQFCLLQHWNPAVRAASPSGSLLTKVLLRQWACRQHLPPSVKRRFWLLPKQGPNMGENIAVQPSLWLSAGKTIRPRRLLRLSSSTNAFAFASCSQHGRHVSAWRWGVRGVVLACAACCLLLLRHLLLVLVEVNPARVRPLCL
jgi:hypothetical protein